jgi:hypothetical protein
MSQEDNQDTRESPALDPNEVQFSSEDAAAVGDPAAAGTDAEGDPGSAPVEAPGAGETAATFTTGAVPQGEPAAVEAQDETSAPAGSPAAAQERANAGGDSPLERPEIQILGAFVGAFVLAKLLQWLFSRD